MYTLNWPEDFPNKGDITDFFVKCNQTAEDFQELLDKATKYEDPLLAEQRIADESEACDVHLADSAEATLYGKKNTYPYNG